MFSCKYIIDFDFNAIIKIEKKYYYPLYNIFITLGDTDIDILIKYLEYNDTKYLRLNLLKDEEIDYIFNQKVKNNSKIILKIAKALNLFVMLTRDDLSMAHISWYKNT